MFLTSKYSYLLFSSTPPIILKLKTANGWEIATHMEQSNSLANQQQAFYQPQHHPLLNRGKSPLVESNQTCFDFSLPNFLVQGPHGEHSVELLLYFLFLVVPNISTSNLGSLEDRKVFDKFEQTNLTLEIFPLYLSSKKNSSKYLELLVRHLIGFPIS
jgi:hypothetical protein